VTNWGAAEKVLNFKLLIFTLAIFGIYIFDLLIQFVIIRSPRLLLGFSSFKFVYALTRFFISGFECFYKYFDI